VVDYAVILIIISPWYVIYVVNRVIRTCCSTWWSLSFTDLYWSLSIQNNNNM